MDLGSLIRRYRKEQKLTLRAVAERSGISEGFLSQVENSVSSPSVDSLINICKAIGINAGDLLNKIDAQEKLVVIRKADWDDVEIPHTGFITRRFFPPENRSVIDSAILVIQPGKSIPVRKGFKNAQELLCILKGSIKLTHGDQIIHLSEGDSTHFWSEQEKQSISNTSDEITIALWVGTF